MILRRINKIGSHKFTYDILVNETAVKAKKSHLKKQGLTIISLESLQMVAMLRQKNRMRELYFCRRNDIPLRGDELSRCCFQSIEKQMSSTLLVMCNTNCMQTISKGRQMK